MEIRRADSEDVAVLQVRGDIEGFDEVTQLKRAVQEVVREGKKRFVLDLKELVWLSSLGLGALVGCYKVVREGKGFLCLARANEQIMSLLRMTNLTRAFQVYSDITEAVNCAAAYDASAPQEI
jgi:anti-sigma B factor antagonist